MNIKPGDTFVIDPEGGSNAHLWIVLAVYQPDLSYEDWVLIVSITTLDRAKFVDSACIVNAGDHPFISHESFAHYQRMRELELSTLAACVTSGRPPCSQDLLTRLIEGLHRSQFTRRGFKGRVPRKS